MALFQYLPLKKIQDRYDEGVNDELDKHGAKLDFKNLPLQRRQQINFTRNNLRNLANNSEYDEETISKIATAIVWLQKLMIGAREYSENKKENSWWDKVNLFKGSAENSFMYRNSEYVIGITLENKFTELNMRECLFLLKEYLSNDLNIKEKIDPECLSKAKALSFIYEKIAVLKEAELKQAAKNLNHVTDGQKLYAIDPVEKMKHLNLIETKRSIKLNHITLPTPLSMVERMKLERIRLGIEISKFDKSTLKHVETEEKRAPLRFKFFRDPKAYMSQEEVVAYDKARESLMSNEHTRPNTPAIRKK